MLSEQILRELLLVFLPVNAGFAGESEAVFPSLRRAEDQVNVHALRRQQSAKTVIRLDINKLEKEKDIFVHIYRQDLCIS